MFQINIREENISFLIFVDRYLLSSPEEIFFSADGWKRSKSDEIEQKLKFIDIDSR